MGFPSEASFFLHPHGIFPGATMRHNRQGRPSWAKSAQARVLLCTGSTWHTIFPVSLPVQWRSTTGRLPGQARSSRDAFVGRRGCVCVLTYLCLYTVPATRLPGILWFIWTWENWVLGKDCLYHDEQLPQHDHNIFIENDNFWQIWSQKSWAQSFLSAQQSAAQLSPPPSYPNIRYVHCTVCKLL